MGTSLTGLTPSTTYDALIKVGDNGPLSATAKVLSDGLGNDSPLAMSTTLVGIGTTTPSSILHIASSGTPRLTLQDTDGGAGNVGILFRESTNDKWTLASAGGNFQFFNEATASNALYITNANNVGIGTTTPNRQLSISAINPQMVLQSTTTTGFSELYFGDTTADNGYIGYAHNGDYMYFGTNNSAHMRITSDGYIRMASGTGGIQFNGDTSAANALDDYEEGTWTMGVSFGGGNTGVTYANNTGTYTKIGRQVTVTGYGNLTSKGSDTGLVSITGLPFTIANTLSAYSSVSLHLDKVTFANQYSGYGVVGTTLIELREVTEAGVGTAITNADFANDSSWVLSFTYFV